MDPSAWRARTLGDWRLPAARIARTRSTQSQMPMWLGNAAAIAGLGNAAGLRD
ncbi:hypothetical protein FF011L_37450 [Roseimaritima multifibrata]|uniref:Uncharacterized protein n=1 Tax=Roseimaritima multifibrata TaxID=1930274 RepID=A0A517MJ86_9BACT|nr:hypothetical protein FF011L_37450 [Roseimaritima multifibrata]